MEIENLECQLAQAQMSRYLAGDTLPEDTVQQLELHIGSCPACSAVAAEQKISLEEMLTASKASPVVAPELEVVAPNIREGVAPAIDQDVINAAMEQLESAPEPEPAVAAEETPEEAPAKKKFQFPALNLAALREVAAKNFKPLLIGFALGAVLIGMGAFAKKPTDLLGKKVSEVHEEGEKEKTEEEGSKKKDSEHSEEEEHSTDEKTSDEEHAAPAEDESSHGKDEAADTTHEGEAHGEQAKDEDKADEHASSEKEPDAKHESEPETKPKHAASEGKKMSEAHAANEGVQEYEVAKSDGHVVSKKYDGQVKVGSKPVTKPAAKAQKPAPKVTAGHGAKKSASTKRRTYRPRAKRSTTAPKTQSPKNLKSGQGYIKVYED